MGSNENYDRCISEVKNVIIEKKQQFDSLLTKTDTEIAKIIDPKYKSLLHITQDSYELIFKIVEKQNKQYYKFIFAIVSGRNKMVHKDKYGWN